MAASASTYLKVSVAVALGTMALKALAWWVTDSVGLLSDALESSVNLIGALFALAMVTVAAQPPDDEHPFGHNKAEYFSSGLEGGLIFVAAAAIAAAAIWRLAHPQPIERLGLGTGLSLASALANGLLAMAMLKHSRQQHSVALEADARHLLTDVWTTAGVLVGLFIVMLTGKLWVDPVVALLVAANIAREGYKLMRVAVDGLMDRALEPSECAQIDAVLARFAADNLRFDHVRTRRAGAQKFVEAHLHVPGHWTLTQAEAVRSQVERALMDALPGLAPVLQMLPADTA